VGLNGDGMIARIDPPAKASLGWRVGPCCFWT